ncbi:hypothetical protein RUESEDTHA_03378 [Ruegeria sp. THAF57]|uniref:hypothetical protein n=1 Tax=unclassified Ruegeria TaxID=2625375 RepID=UPI001487D467|nr:MULTISPECIES: hypothetical protein [unclassified Ruegeria]CAD0186470.1 hypothetical protein RUESEDTHA_03378 [Ruegeria sp. THAF57]
MKTKLVAGLSLVLFIAACAEKETYPISGCDSNETFPVTCEEIGEDTNLDENNAQDLNALPTGA